MTEGEKPRPCASGDKCPPRARPPDTDKEREISYWRWRRVCSWLRHSFTGCIALHCDGLFYCQTKNSFVPVEYSSVHLKSILNLTKIFHSLVKYICCMFDMSPRRARERGRVEGVLCCGYGARLSDECGDTGERGANVDSDQGDCLQSWHVHNADNIAGTRISTTSPSVSQW